MIQHLKARGFTGIKRGMNLDEIEIDFTGREGLLCLDGKNGAGKTSVLDLLHPFDCLASRDGSLYNHCHMRDSVKDLSFTHGGHHYRTLLKIDSQSGKSEGFAYVDGSTASEVKGKISEYHRWAVSTFGSPELFFASLFCSQNSKKFSDMRVSELKALFVEFLRLERYEAWADTSKQAGNILEGQMKSIDERIRALTAQIDGREAGEIALKDAEAKAAELAEQKSALLLALAEKRQQADALKETIAQNGAQLQRRADLQAQIEKTTTDMGREKGAAEAEIEGLKAKYREVAAEIKKVEAVLAEKEQIEGAAARAQELEAAITVLQEAVDKAERDRERAQEEVHRIEKEIESLKQIRKDLEDDKDLRELVAKGVELQGKANEQAAAIKALSNDPETARLTAELATLKSRAAERDLYDPACTSTICAAIAEALKAKEKVPAAEEALKARTEEVTRLKAAAQAIIDAHAPEIENFRQAMRYREKWIAAEKTRLAGEIGPLGHSLQNHQQVVQGNTDIATLKRREIVTIRSAIATKKALATRLPDLRVAESRKQELNKQQAENVAAGSEKNKALNETIARFNETLAGLNETIRQIDATINYDAEAGLKDLMAEIKEIETMNLPNSDNLIERAKSRLAALKGDLDRITAAGKELTSVRVERDALASRVSHWRYLQNACGKNGLQALEIDGAAPLISSRANELLMRGYGPQYTVRIDTQDEEGREDLDIKVLSEWGTDSLKMKSGGERVWLLHAVRLAMALLNKEKSGRAWDMAFFDEVTGALDSKGAASSFMSMYQPFMALGGIKQAFFVTHQDECLSYADHILRFEPGKNPAWQ